MRRVVLLENGHAFSKRFFRGFFLENIDFLKKQVNEKIFITLFPIKKDYIHFCRKMPLSLSPSRMVMPAKKWFSRFFWRIYVFLLKSNLMEKSTPYFQLKWLYLFLPCNTPFPWKNGPPPKKQFSAIFGKILFFFRKNSLVEKYSVLFVVKRVIFIFFLKCPIFRKNCYPLQKRFLRSSAKILQFLKNSSTKKYLEPHFS